ncbi:MAG: glycosyltransferase family 39 protein [candidate division Zixibacteria bacterium]|nr:glycosyltransferase family 39 protein [candidate division Zixibacteria bacterium]
MQTSRLFEKLSRHSRWLTPLLIFLAAFSIRVVYLNQISTIPTFEKPIMDEQYHLALAEQINSEEGLPDEPYYRAPLYPYFLAAVFNLTAESVYWTRIIQILLGALLPLLLYFLGLMLFNRSVAFWSAAIAAFYPTFLYYDSALLITSLMVLLTTLLILQLYRCEKNPVPLQFILAGLLLGLAGLARPNILLLGPFLIIWIMLVIKPQLGWKKALFSYGLIALASFVVVLPVTIRNYTVGDDSVFISWQGGYNFYIGNNRQATGWSATVPGIDATWGGGYKQSIAIAEKSRGKQLKRSEVSDFWFGLAFKEIKQDPANFFSLQLKKLRLFANGFEIPNNQNIYLAREFSPLISLLMFDGVLFFPYGLLLPLALLGLAFSVRYWRKYLLIYLLLSSYLVTLMLFFVCARFRQPLIPLLIMLAVFGVGQLIKFFKKRDVKNLSLTLLVFVLLVVESNHDITGIDRNHLKAEDHMLLGTAYLDQGRLESAKREFSKSIKFDPAFALPYNNLGLISLRRGDANAASQYFLKAIQSDPQTLEPYFNLATQHIEKRQFEQALEILYQARQNQPLNDFVHLKIGSTLYQLGRIDEAKLAIEESLRLNPDSEVARLSYQQIIDELNSAE